MKIIYTRKAKADLNELREFLQPQSPSGLQNVVGDILGLTEALPSSIARGRITDHPDVFEKLTPKYSYLIPYTVYQGDLYILRVYHPSRKKLDYTKIVDLRE